MKFITILLSIIPFLSFAQFEKVFDNYNEYYFSNKVQEAYQSSSYNYCNTMLDSVLSYTQAVDRYVLSDGISCSIKTFKKDRIEKLLSIFVAQEIDLSNDVKTFLKEEHPNLAEQFSLNMKDQKPKITDPELGQTLFQMLLDDQICRSMMIDPFLKKGDKLGYNVTLNHELTCNEADSINGIKLDCIIASGKPLTKESVGKFGILSIFLVVQHSSNLSEHKELIDQLYENGDMEPRNYALFHDRYNLRNEMPQIYGTQYSCDAYLGMTDLENVDKKRMTVGLMSIERYSKLFGNVWQTFIKGCKTE